MLLSKLQEEIVRDRHKLAHKVNFELNLGWTEDCHMNFMERHVSQIVPELEVVWMVLGFPGNNIISQTN